MALELENIAKSLFEKIRARFSGISVGDNEAKTASDPGQARFFNFDYVDALGNNFGNVTISLVDENSLKIYFGKNLSADLDETQKAEWYDFLRDIRMFAKRNLLSFDTRDISRSNLNIKDLQQLAQVERPKDANDTSVTESKLYGTAKTSYDTIAPGVRLIVRHSNPIDDTIHGARSRKIHKIYIEDPEGQRFMSPFTHIGGSRALGRHVAAGGQIGDDFGSHIQELVQELSKLNKFLRGTRNKTFEDGEANDIVNAAKERYRKVHGILGKLRGPKGYKIYKEQWNPGAEQGDEDTSALREKFTVKKFDDRLEDGLPYAQRAYRSMQQEFAESLDQIAEGTWAMPDNDLAIQHLQELMADVLPAGIDGTDATGALYDILGDDQLFDRIYDASRGSPEMDVRPIIYDFLKTNMPSVFEKVRANMENGGEQEQAAPAPEPQQESKEYYSVESNSPPFYIHATDDLELAEKHLEEARNRGQTDAVIYEVRVINGKKVKNKTGVDKPVQESKEVAAIRRLAGLA